KNYKGQLFSLQCLLQQQASTSGSKLILVHQPPDKIFRRSRVLCDEHSLTGTQAIGLYDHGKIDAGKRSHSFARRAKRAIHFRCGDILAPQKLLREDLATFELRSLPRRCDYRPPAAPECVANTVNQRQFWPDDGEIGT